MAGNDELNGQARNILSAANPQITPKEMFAIAIQIESRHDAITKTLLQYCVTRLVISNRYAQQKSRGNQPNSAAMKAAAAISNPMENSSNARGISGTIFVRVD